MGFHILLFITENSSLLQLPLFGLTFIKYSFEPSASTPWNPNTFILYTKNLNLIIYTHKGLGFQTMFVKYILSTKLENEKGGAAESIIFVLSQVQSSSHFNGLWSLERQELLGMKKNLNL